MSQANVYPVGVACQITSNRRTPCATKYVHFNSCLPIIIKSRFISYNGLRVMPCRNKTGDVAIRTMLTSFTRALDHIVLAWRNAFVVGSKIFYRQFCRPFLYARLTRYCESTFYAITMLTNFKGRHYNTPLKNFIDYNARRMMLVLMVFMRLLVDVNLTTLIPAFL